MCRNHMVWLRRIAGFVVSNLSSFIQALAIQLTFQYPLRLDLEYTQINININKISFKF